MAVAKAETPVVNGYFCLPTEAHDNDGLPHILEHLIFLGSEGKISYETFQNIIEIKIYSEYPYKEALDYLGMPSSPPPMQPKYFLFLQIFT